MAKGKVTISDDVDHRSQPGRFGTFGGVFTPCTLTILGVIMFLRFGQVVGQAGVLEGILIVLLAKAITLLTTLSLSAIATNTRLRGGGAYFLISRSLGVESGGAIGLVFFLAQTISVAMYVVGFTEAFLSAFPQLGLSSVTIATIVNLLVFVSVMVGADWAIKIQYGILALLLISLASFYTGAIGAFSVKTLKNNLHSNYLSGDNFFTMFALFFPAVTGIMAGANMSGDLKDPGKSLPQGTLTSIGITALVYLSQLLLFAGTRSAESLIGNNLVIKEISIFSPFITLGIFAATLSSAITSMMGSPRVLQAIARDDIFKVLKIFRQSSGPTQEPRYATIFTFLIAQLSVMLDDLNFIAPIITMFFIVTYGMINLATFYESISGNPSYRPQFRFSHWITALLGVLGCLGVMFLMAPIWATFAVVTMGGLYLRLSQRKIKVQWGDARSGVKFSSIRRNLLKLETSGQHQKNWRPTILGLTGIAGTRKHIAIYGYWLTAGQGILTLAQVITGQLENMAERRRNQERLLKKSIEELDLPAFPVAVVAKDLTHGIEALVQCHGIGAVRPNCVMIGWSSDRERMEAFGILLQNLAKLNSSILAIRSTKEIISRWQVLEGSIDVWWRGKKNGRLMLLLAHLLRQNPQWRGRPIRLFRAISSELGRNEAMNGLRTLIMESRISATPEIIVSNDVPSSIRSISASAAAVFLGFEPPPEGNEEAFVNSMNHLTNGLQTVIFVYSATEFSL